LACVAKGKNKVFNQMAWKEGGVGGGGGRGGDKVAKYRG